MNAAINRLSVSLSLSQSVCLSYCWSASGRVCVQDYLSLCLSVYTMFWLTLSTKNQIVCQPGSIGFHISGPLPPHFDPPSPTPTPKHNFFINFLMVLSAHVKSVLSCAEFYNIDSEWQTLGLGFLSLRGRTEINVNPRFRGTTPHREIDGLRGGAGWMSSIPMSEYPNWDWGIPENTGEWTKQLMKRRRRNKLRYHRFKILTTLLINCIIGGVGRPIDCKCHFYSKLVIGCNYWCTL